MRKKRFRFKIAVSKIRGIGLICIHGKKYRALWLEWADGGQADEHGKLDPIWIWPRVRYVHT